MTERLKFLCVCHNDITRSVMLAYLLQEALSKSRIEAVVESASMLDREGRKPYIYTIMAMQQRHLDVSHHVSQKLTGLALESYTTVFCFDTEVAYALRGRGVNEQQIMIIEGVADPRYEDLDVHHVCAGILAHEAEKIVRQYPVFETHVS